MKTNHHVAHAVMLAEWWQLQQVKQKQLYLHQYGEHTL